MIEAMKSLGMNASRVRSESTSRQNALENKAEDVKAQSMSQAIKQNTQENEEEAKSLQDLTKELNEQMDKLDTNIAFAFSDETERLYVKVLEKNTGKLIREFPTEQARALTGYLKSAVGILFDKES